MLVTNAMLLLASMTAVEAPQLYYFTSDNCPACKQVEPVVDELADHGVPVVRVNAHQQQQWTQKANVTALPTFIVVGQGKETGRVVGAVNFRDLSHLYFTAVRQVAATGGTEATPRRTPPNERKLPIDSLVHSQNNSAPRTNNIAGSNNAGSNNAGSNNSSRVPAKLVNNNRTGTDSQIAEQVRGQSNRLSRPGARLGSLWDSLKGLKKNSENCQDCRGPCDCPTSPPTSPLPNDPLRVQPVQYQSAPVAGDQSLPINSIAAPTNTIEKNDNCVDCALAATVRLKIVDELGQSFGTGTIIDVHKDEALVLTCGHIFRDSDGKGKVLCDSFAPGARAGIEGKVISFDIRRDIGLVSFRPGVPVKAVRVGGTSQRPRESESVFAIGCNRGDDPSIIENKIIAVNRYHGPPNLVVGGRPIDGRSGGGLFNENGSLIGVCNAADPEFDEGLYAALGNVHAELDSVGLGFIYRKNQPSLAFAEAAPLAKSNEKSRGRLQQHAPEPLPPRTGESNRTTVSEEFNAPQALSSEPLPPLVAKFRSPTDPTVHTELVIERPSKDLLDQLMREANRRGPHRQTQLQTANNYQEGWRSLAPK